MYCSDFWFQTNTFTLDSTNHITKFDSFTEVQSIVDLADVTEVIED